MRYAASALELVRDIRGHTKEIQDKSLWFVFGVIGAALSQWSQMETALVVVASLLLRTQSQKAGLVLYSIVNFNIWLGVIDELFTVDEKLSTLKPRWNKISARLRKLKDDRDRLAHHYVTSQEVRGATEIPATLDVPFLDARQKSLKFLPMTIEQINQFRATTLGCANDLARLIDDMARTLGIAEWAKRGGLAWPDRYP
jgi:hypothetical protein